MRSRKDAPDDDDPARRDRVQDIEDWWNDPEIQRRIADLIARAAEIRKRDPDRGNGDR
jgi:hypothetical protein